MTALDGKDATIPCEAEGAPPPNVTWYFNGGQISFSGRIQILEEGSVLIAKVRSTDQGKYTCTRANEAGEVSASAWVEVMVRTQIVLPPVDTKVSLKSLARAENVPLNWQRLRFRSLQVTQCVVMYIFLPVSKSLLQPPRYLISLCAKYRTENFYA